MNDDLINRQRILRIITGAYVKSKDIDSFYALLQTAFENILPDARVEQDCVLKQFGDCSYAETGCSDCAITAKIRKALKTAQPERKGNWSIKNGELAIWDVCSECGRMVIHRAPFYNYCPNCGADMRGEQNEK